MLHLPTPPFHIRFLMDTSQELRRRLRLMGGGHACGTRGSARGDFVRCCQTSGSTVEARHNEGRRADAPSSCYSSRHICQMARRPYEMAWRCCQRLCWCRMSDEQEMASCRLIWRAGLHLISGQDGRLSPGFIYHACSAAR